MWITELATNTATADSTIGSHKDDNAVIAPPPRGSGKCLDSRNRATEDQRVDVVRALVGVHHFEVDDVPDHTELVGYAVAAEHVARDARDVERLAAGISFHDRGDLDRRRAFVLHAAQAQAALQAERDLGLHVGELLLHQLICGERAAELL